MTRFLGDTIDRPEAAGTVCVTGTEGMPIGKYPFRFMLVDRSDRVGYAPNSAAADVWQAV